MPSVTRQSPLKMRTMTGQINLICIELKTANCKLMTASTAAADTHCTAVASAE